MITTWDQTEFKKWQEDWFKRYTKRMDHYFGTKTVRARTKKGTYKKDDPKTLKNEAYKTTKAAFNP